MADGAARGGPRISFKPQMVRALLEGRKTQTRRLVTWRGRAPGGGGVWVPDGRRALVGPGGRRADVLRMPCVAGDVADVLEPFFSLNDTECDGDAFYDCGPTLDIAGTPVQYAASPLNPAEPGEPGSWEPSPPDGWDGESEDDGTWGSVWVPWEHYTAHPAIHMPRWAVRLRLRVVDVRVERLRDVTDEDARAEGVPDPGPGRRASHRDVFRDLWESINGRRARWAANPWVYRICFEVLSERGASPGGGAT